MKQLQFHVGISGCSEANEKRAENRQLHQKHFYSVLLEALSNQMSTF